MKIASLGSPRKWAVLACPHWPIGSAPRIRKSRASDVTWGTCRRGAEVFVQSVCTSQRGEAHTPSFTLSPPFHSVFPRLLRLPPLLSVCVSLSPQARTSPLSPTHDPSPKRDIGKFQYPKPRNQRTNGSYFTPRYGVLNLVQRRNTPASANAFSGGPGISTFVAPKPSPAQSWRH